MIYTQDQLKKVIRVPAGGCPITFASLCNYCKNGATPSKITIIDWFWQIREWGLRRGEFLTAEAIVYYVRYEYDPSRNKQEYEEVRDVIYGYAKHINDPFSDQISVSYGSQQEIDRTV